MNPEEANIVYDNARKTIDSDDPKTCLKILKCIFCCYCPTVIRWLFKKSFGKCLSCVRAFGTYTRNLRRRFGFYIGQDVSSDSSTDLINHAEIIPDRIRPRSSSRTIVPPSLTNYGASCYLNSAFQGISACDIFVEEINNLCKDYDKVKQLEVFKELIDILNGCSKRRMSISQNLIFRNWNRPGQQDSYELLAYALNQVYNELRAYMERINKIPKRDLHKWLLQELPMRFILSYKIVCECKMVSFSPLQSDLALHVTIPTYKNEFKLIDLIDQYFSDDPIEDFICDNKNCYGKMAKRLARLRRPIPRTFCIHLQRTFWNGFRMVKINTKVDFELQMKIKSEYIDEQDSGIAEINVSEPVNHNLNNENIEVIQAQMSPEPIVFRDCEKAQDAQEETQYRRSSSQLESSDCDMALDAMEVSATEAEKMFCLETPAVFIGSSLMDTQENDVPEEKETMDNLESNIYSINSDSKEEAPMIEIYPFLNTFCDVTSTDTATQLNSESESCQILPESKGDPIMIEQNDSMQRAYGDDWSEVEEINKNLEGGICTINSDAKEEASMIKTYPVLNSYKDVQKEEEFIGQIKSCNSPNLTINADGPENNIASLHNTYQRDQIYTLVSVIEHSGHVDGGHYVCYKRVCGRWFLTNDSRVTEVEEKRVLDCQAYILFYEQLAID